MGRRRIGQEGFRFGSEGGGRPLSSLVELAGLIDWAPIEKVLADIHSAAKGEPAWPPLALFKAMLIAVWYDLSDVKLAEALDDRSSFRRFCGFALQEPTPERSAFVRLRKELVTRGLDKDLFDEVTRQLKAKAVRVKTGTLVDATVIASASERDGEARWSGHQKRKAVCRASLPRTCGDAKATAPNRSCATGMTRSTACVAVSRRSSAPGSAATDSVACDGRDWPRPRCRCASPRSPTT